MDTQTLILAVALALGIVAQIGLIVSRSWRIKRAERQLQEARARLLEQAADQQEAAAALNAAKLKAHKGDTHADSAPR